MTSKRDELKFQDHIIDSYKLSGGFGKKWATDLQVGVPDLILSFPGVGLHLAEVKHRPDWALGRKYTNPLNPKQRQVARDYLKAGAKVVGMVVTGGTAAPQSVLTVFDPTAEAFVLYGGFKYEPGTKFPISRVLGSYYGHFS